MIDTLIQPVAGLLDKFIADKDQAAALAHEIATMSERHAQEVALAQIEVNKIEAGSQSIFKSGYRPFLGWVCGAAFAYHFVLQPIAVFGLAYAGIETPPLPEFDMSTLLTVLGGILGLGTMRTVERLQGKVPNGK